MPGKKTAAKLDAAASKLHRAGKKVGGELGGRAGDAIATAALGGLRARCNVDCTHKGGCTHS